MRRENWRKCLVGGIARLTAEEILVGHVPLEEDSEWDLEWDSYGCCDCCSLFHHALCRRQS